MNENLKLQSGWIWRTKVLGVGEVPKPVIISLTLFFSSLTLPLGGCAV